jgi:hypothetical protein
MICLSILLLFFVSASLICRRRSGRERDHGGQVGIICTLRRPQHAALEGCLAGVSVRGAFDSLSRLTPSTATNISMNFGQPLGPRANLDGALCDFWDTVGYMHTARCDPCSFSISFHYSVVFPYFLSIQSQLINQIVCHGSGNDPQRFSWETEKGIED